MYSTEPDDPQKFERDFNAFYTRLAPLYGLLLTAIPTWTNWTSQVLPHVVGPRVLEVSFGTGHLLVRLASHHRAFGIDLNRRLAKQAAARLTHHHVLASLQVATVARIPYADGVFDSVVSTMAFSGFPDGRLALVEMRRVLKPGGILAMVDVNYPADRNPLGTMLTRFWKASGDLIRDVPALFRQTNWACTDREVGGSGSVHLYLAVK